MTQAHLQNELIIPGNGSESTARTQADEPGIEAQHKSNIPTFLVDKFEMLPVKIN